MVRGLHISSATYIADHPKGQCSTTGRYSQTRSSLCPKDTSTRKANCAIWIGSLIHPSSPLGLGGGETFLFIALRSSLVNYLTGFVPGCISRTIRSSSPWHLFWRCLISRRPKTQLGKRLHRRLNTRGSLGACPSHVQRIHLTLISFQPL